MITEMDPVYPQVKFVIDPIKTSKDLLETIGFPVKDFNSEEQITQLLGEYTAKMQQEKMLAAAPGLAKGIKALGGKVEPSSPLAAMNGEEGG